MPQTAATAAARYTRSGWRVTPTPVAAEEKEKAAPAPYDAIAEIVARKQKAFIYLYKTALVVFGLALAILIYAV